MPTPRCWHGRNRTLWFSVEKICVVFWMLSVNINELSKVYSNIFYVPWIFVTIGKLLAVRFSLYCWNVISLDFQPIIGRFYKMRVSWEFNIYNLLILLLTRYYRFLARCEYYLWLDSKYNVRRCDVLVRNKTIHSLNLFALDRIFL